MARPGPRNLITDVDGILVGNAEDNRVRTGTTVILAEQAATAGVDIRGGAPGTRETPLLDPVNLIERIDAICLSGGSAFGLDAASGVMHFLAEQGRGFAIGEARVPLVPAAILFDLLNGGDKGWAHEPPYRLLGRAAVAAAGRDFRLGNAGAGHGAMAGTLKGGLGSASVITEDGLQVGAIVAANPVGSVVDGDTGAFWAQPLSTAGEANGRRAGWPRADMDLPPDMKRPRIGANTTIGVVATNATLDKAQANRIAIMAHDGLARAIRPVHTPTDGDTMFAMATARRPLDQPAPAALTRIGHLAADCVARAVIRAIVAADSLGNGTSYRDRYGD